MPYITKTIKEARKEFKKSNKVYKLCYVDSIPRTTFGYRPEIKEKYKFLEGLSYIPHKTILQGTCIMRNIRTCHGNILSIVWRIFLTQTTFLENMNFLLNSIGVK